MTSVTSAELVRHGRSLGLTAVAVASARVQEPARSALHHRRQAGLAGSMQFTYRNPDRSTDPSTPLPSARSWVVAALRYPDQVADSEPSTGVVGRVGRYAWQDHYQQLREALEVVADLIRADGHRAVVVADSNAMVDRNVAWLAGLGWYGKNSNLLLPGVGSWCVLGAVVTDAELEATGSPLDDGCGRCVRCIDACPTNAIVGPGIVDATACIAWLVQAPGPIPPRYREAIADRIYGCDDCQTICPPNRRAPASVTIGPGSDPDTVQDRIDMIDLLSWTDERLEADCGRWYIAGRDLDLIRRTALVVVGNSAIAGIDPVLDGAVQTTLARYLTHPRALLRSHALWAARRLGLDWLTESLRADPDPEVQGEWALEVTRRFRPEDWHRPVSSTGQPVDDRAGEERASRRSGTNRVGGRQAQGSGEGR